MENPNEHVQIYLQDYINRHDPGYAVLVEAPWGAGKTHLIKELIKKQSDDAKPLYISLFGANNSDDINAVIMMARLPALDNDFVKVGGRFGAALMKLLPLDLTDFKPADFAKLKLPKVLIFDDLERTNMNAKELLGYLNEFVEHEGKHLIVLANEDELWKGQDRRAKEKLIGHTLTIQADVDAAFESIVEKLKEKDVRGFLTKTKSTVVQMFEQSKTNNLRALGQCLGDFERLFTVLEKRHRENTDGMLELLMAFLALSIEYKSGGLDREDLKQRGSYILDQEKHPEHKKLIEVSQKYSGVGIRSGQYSDVLSTDLAISVICDGRVVAKTVNDALSQTRFFVQVKDEAEWQTIWWARHREEDDVTNAIQKMERKFKDREYHDPGIVLHVFRNRLYLPQMGCSDCEIHEIEKECVAYIDAVVGSGNLPAFDPKKDWGEGYGYSNTAYLGLGWPSGESDVSKTFWRLYKCMQEAQMKLFQDSFAGICRDLLDLMGADVDRFEALLSGRSKDTVYVLHPVLTAMDIKAFTDKLLSLDVETQAKVFLTMKERYLPHRVELDPEHDWLRGLEKELDSRLPELLEFRKWQVDSEMDSGIRPITSAWDDEADGDVF